MKLSYSFLTAITLTIASGAQAGVQVVNSAASLGGTTSTITFDAPNGDTIAELAANYGVQINSLANGAAPFIAGPGSYSGIGTVSSNVLGNSLNGQISNIAYAPDYSGSSMQEFEIVFATAVQAVGLDVSGWGFNNPGHLFDLYDSNGNNLAHLTFGQAGLSVWDGGYNGFAGFISDAAAIKRITVTPQVHGQDFVAFDNLTFVAAPGVPEPESWALMIGGFALAGAAMRRRAAAALRTA